VNLLFRALINRKNFIKAVLFLSLLGIVSPSIGVAEGVQTQPPVSGREMSVESIVPADVFARVQLFRKVLDDVRFEMGKRKSQDIGLLVEEAAPHEVFFQAKTLYRKTDQLVVEITEDSAILLQEKDPKAIRPFHVWKVVDKALHRILHLREKLGMSLSNSEGLADPTTTPTTVFFALGFANKQLNHLLVKQFSPKEVIKQVGLSIGYTNRLLEEFPASIHRSSLPTLVRGRRPSDVFSRLVDCYIQIGEIASKSKVKMLRLNSRNLDRIDVQPNDVYDLATLLVSELVYLHSQVSHDKPPRHVSPAGPTFPSHVDQQAGLLLGKLQELNRQVQNNPQWLNK